jgi:predicted DNA-binding transcriptional regulator AlpA
MRKPISARAPTLERRIHSGDMKSNRKHRKGARAMPTAITERPNSERPILSVKETARFLGVSESLIWKEIRVGNLKPRRIGDRVFFSRVYLQRFCESE